MDKRIKKDEEEVVERLKVDVVQLTEENVRISNHPYKLIENYRNGFDVEKLAERYSDVLKKYDYIVGDWGYDQLRLKGFYNKNYSQAKLDQRIENVEDYLLEYCNFGCAYFVLENLKKMPKSKLKKQSRFNNNKRTQPNKKNNTKKPQNKKPQKSNNTEKTTQKKTTPKKRNFNIRKINEEK